MLNTLRAAADYLNPFGRDRAIDESGEITTIYNGRIWTKRFVCSILILAFIASLFNLLEHQKTLPLAPDKAYIIMFFEIMVAAVLFGSAVFYVIALMTSCCHPHKSRPGETTENLIPSSDGEPDSPRRV